jgi:hypothetical protein
MESQVPANFPGKNKLKKKVRIILCAQKRRKKKHLWLSLVSF